MIEIKQVVQYTPLPVAAFSARLSIRRVRRWGEINPYHTHAR